MAAHGPSGAWGTMAVSLFAESHCAANVQMKGLVFGGGAEAWRHLGIQALGVLILAAISLSCTYAPWL